MRVFVFAKGNERDREKARERERVCVVQLDTGQMKSGSCFGCSLLPKCPDPPSFTAFFHIFSRYRLHPSLFYHIAWNLFPGAEATLMWED